MKWLFGKRPRRASAREWPLEQVLLQWAAGTPWTIRDAFQGTQILGSTGSGKTSASLKTIVMSMLRSGFGGVFFTVKPEDRATYEQWIEKAGRRDDLLIFSPSAGLRYNFMAAELEQTPDVAAAAENLTALVMTAAEAGDRSRGSAGGGENATFFVQNSEKYCRNLVLVLRLSGNPITPQNLLRMVMSTPRTVDDLKSLSWQASSFCFQCLRKAESASMRESERADLGIAVDFICNELPNLNSRTRSSIESTLTGALDALGRGLVRDMISSPSSNFSASMLHDGAIVIVDFPVLVYRDVGRLIQVMLKASLQRAHSRRDVRANPRPDFMVCDEYQYLVVDSDQPFQSIARGFNIAVVNATQSITTVMDALGPQSEVKVNALLGNLQTQIFHQQTDTRTISYIQELVGRSRQLMVNGNSTRGGDWLAPLFGNSSGGSSGFSEAYEFELQARDLNGLAKGGPPHWTAEGIVYQGGRRFPNGRTWMPVTFRQDR